MRLLRFLQTQTMSRLGENREHQLSVRIIAASMPSYMYYSTFHWQNLLSGYSGFFPPSFIELTRSLEQFPDADSIDALRRRRAQYVVLHGEVFRPDEYASLVAKADASLDLSLLSTTEWMGAEMRVYKLRTPDAP